MNEDNYLKESVIKCVDYAMEQDDDTKRRIFTGLFEYTDRLVNEDIYNELDEVLDILKGSDENEKD